MKTFILSLIRFYQRYLRMGYACRFSPTCSQYTYEAISHHGIIAGLELGIKRIMRCHPWSPGGYDPIPH